MAWSKLKNIMLIMLLIVNLFLLALVAVRENRSAQYMKSARENVILTFANSGISVDEENIPWEQTLTMQVMERDTERERQGAEALLGACTQTGQGGVYSYVGERGSVRFSRSGGLSASFAATAYPVGDAALEDHALRQLALLRFEGEVVEVVQGRGQAQVCVRQTWSGVPIFSCTATLVYEREHLTGIAEGSCRLTGTPVAVGGEQSLTVATLLIRFLEGITERGDICTAITDMTAGYTLSPSLSDPITLMPTWFIVTDTGVYYLNGLTGALERTGG